MCTCVRPIKPSGEGEGRGGNGVVQWRAMAIGRRRTLVHVLTENGLLGVAHQNDQLICYTGDMPP